mmetsp:Transcript_9624/g.12711  ORF Transcript_9624/g.12711 Transcript_9624/m.12711 type:complete len:367 (+) Transcript_9624:170-1270(+)
MVGIPATILRKGTRIQPLSSFFPSIVLRRRCSSIFSTLHWSQKAKHESNHHHGVVVANCERRSFASASTSSSDQSSTTKQVVRSRSENLLDRVELVWEKNTGVCHVILNNPSKLNSLDMPMFEALVQAGKLIQADTSVRAVILSGKGRAFCTGLNVPAMVNETTTKHNYNPYKVLRQLLERPTTGEQPANLAQQVGYQWRQLPVPVICCLHGSCFGGGMQIALGADFRFATPDCRLSIMETKWGLIPDMSASVTLRELVSIDVAKELTMTGRIITGQEAAALGLVTRCVEDPMAEAHTFCQTIIEKSPDAVSLSKKLYQATWIAVPEDYCLTVETELQKQLLLSWNQIAATGRNFGWKIPYFERKK